MAFEKVDVEASRNADDTGVRVSLVKLKGSAAKLRITVDSDIAGKFFRGNLPTVGRELHVGTGEHHGLIRLVVGEGAPLTAEPRKLGGGVNQRNCLVFNCGHLTHFVDRAEKPQAVRWDHIDAETIEIVLPAWADETRPKPETAEDIQRDMNRAAAERRKRMGMA